MTVLSEAGEQGMSQANLVSRLRLPEPSLRTLLYRMRATGWVGSILHIDPFDTALSQVARWWRTTERGAQVLSIWVAAQRALREV